MTNSQADVCMILEGTYPYVSGGVSTWTHELISRHSDLNFHLLTILPPNADTEPKYNIPSNVVGITDVQLHQVPAQTKISDMHEILEDLEGPLLALVSEEGQLDDFTTILEILANYRGRIGFDGLMNSMAAWELVQRMYNYGYAESSFLDYFWSWRALMGSIFSIALADLPKAHIYHCLSTGYAGIMAARAKIETGNPVILTEHGIYTNERRIEVASADWLEETASKSLTIDHVRNNLRDFWANSFGSFSRICYEASDEIITLYEGNQHMQRADGANPAKMRIIPNGVDIDRFRAIEPVSHERPTVALIGRVVPIKDIKSFIRAVSVIRSHIPDIKVLIMGPTDEDIEYYQECRQMIEYMGLNETVTFTGQVKIDKYLPQIDVTVLSSISEAMPLTILEAGACGIPSVTTDVGACREIIYGPSHEQPKLGDGGAVVPLSNPTALAEAVINLLQDRDYYNKCSDTIRKRIQLYYNKSDQMERYGQLYNSHIKAANEYKKVS